MIDGVGTNASDDLEKAREDCGDLGGENRE